MRKYLIGLAIGIVIMLGVGYPVIISQHNQLDEIEMRVNDVEAKIYSTVVNSMVTEPGNLFKFLEDHPEWEEIDAVPYSRCYRHLIGTTTADYIMCMAI